MANKITISLTIDRKILQMLDKLAELDNRSRSNEVETLTIEKGAKVHKEEYDGA